MEENSWSDTKKAVAKQVSAALKITQETACNMIDRCHRGGNKEFYKNQGKARPIFAAMNRWDDCERIVKASYTTSLRADYKYGPRTTIRRNLALKKRKELKSSGELVKAFVRFPACLVGMKRGETTYKVIEDFSKAPIN